MLARRAIVCAAEVAVSRTSATPAVCSARTSVGVSQWVAVKCLATQRAGFWRRDPHFYKRVRPSKAHTVAVRHDPNHKVVPLLDSQSTVVDFPALCRACFYLLDREGPQPARSLKKSLRLTAQWQELTTREVEQVLHHFTESFVQLPPVDFDDEARWAVGAKIVPIPSDFSLRAIKENTYWPTKKQKRSKRKASSRKPIRPRYVRPSKLERPRIQELFNTIVDTPQPPKKHTAIEGQTATKAIDEAVVKTTQEAVGELLSADVRA